MARTKTAYNTPAGLKYAASCAFSNASMAWILYFIWSLLINTIIKAQNLTGLILTVIGYGINLYAAIKTYSGFESEIQADAIANETTDRSLPVLKKLVLVTMTGRILLTLVAIFFKIKLSVISVSPAYRQIDAIINILAAVFTTVNVLGYFSMKIYVSDGKSPKIRLFSLISLILIVIHFLTAEIKYILILSSPGGKYSVVSVIVGFTAIASYFAMYLMFEARKEKYKSKQNGRRA
ncbi:MAG: hypothetical protein IJL26_03555 [Clostridia bacterium]|nr:hypothetical protein [Clostridia bacterium]